MASDGGGDAISSIVYEGDTIIFYCPEERGFIYAEPPCSEVSHVSLVIPDIPSNPDLPNPLSNPLIPNVHFSAFQLEAVDISKNRSSKPKKAKQEKYKRALVYGSKVKFHHIASKKYLSTPDLGPKDQNVRHITKFSRSHPEEDDPVVILRDKEKVKDVQSFVFTIMPSNKGKLYGDDVLAEDLIILKNNGFNVFCSFNSLTSKYELKLGRVSSPLNIFLYSTSEDFWSKTAVNAGEPVILFSVTHEAFASVCGSFASETMPDLDELVKGEQPLGEKLSESDPSVGKKMESQQSVEGARTKWTRFPVSQRETDFSVRAHTSLEPRDLLQPISREAVWQLEVVGNPLSGAQLVFDHEYRVKHVLTQQYLAVERDTVSLMKVIDLKESHQNITFTLISVKERKGGLNKGFHVELKHTSSNKSIAVQTERHFKRTMSLTGQDTSRSYIHNLMLVDSLKSKDATFRIDELKENEIIDIYHVVAVVTVFRNYLKELMEEGEADVTEASATLTDLCVWLDKPSRLDALRAAEVIEQVMAMLALAPKSDEPSKDMCRKICNVLCKYWETSIDKTVLYLTEERFINILLSKVFDGVGVERFLLLLLENNVKLSLKVIEKLNLESSVLLDENMDVNKLKLISTLCFAGGKPVRSLQQKIQGIILDEKQKLLFETTMAKGELVFAGSVSKSLKKFWESFEDPKRTEHEKKACETFLAYIRLLGNLCKGSNAIVKENILQRASYISFDDVKRCLEDKRLDARLRLHYLEFAIAAFVDSEVEASGTDIENIWSIYEWKHITAEPLTSIKEKSRKDSPYSFELQDIIMTQLKEEKLWYTEKNRDNIRLIVKMLEAIEMLVAYGFYWRDFEDLVESLTRILKSDNYKLVYSPVKTKAICILHLLFKQFQYLAVRKFVYKFQVTSLEKSPLAGRHMDDTTDQDKLESFSDVCSKLLSSHFNNPTYAKFQIPKGPLINILTKILWASNDNDLRIASAKLLFDIHNRENLLFCDAFSSYLATDHSMSEVKKLLPLGTLSDDEKLLVKMHHGRLSKDEKATLLQNLSEIADNCLMRGDPSEPHKCLQSVTYSTGIFNQLLQFVVKRHTLTLDPDVEIVEKACEVLINCTHKNPTIQLMMFEVSLEMLDAEIAVYHVAKLFTEVLTDNAACCQKLSKDHLAEMFQLATNPSSGSTDHCELCTTLQAAIKVSKRSGSLIQANQCQVAELYKEIGYSLCIVSKRSGSLIQANQRQVEELYKEIGYSLCINTDQKSMTFVVNAVDLLCVCVEQDCKVAMDYCHRDFNLDILLSIITNSSIPLVHRKPYARLLAEGFINSRLKSTCNALIKKDSFWEHIKFCTKLLDDVCSAVEDGTQASLVRSSLKVLATCHLSIRGWKELTSDLSSDVEEGVMASDSTSDEQKGVSLSAALLYLFDGAIPLITAFCFEFDRLSNSGPAAKKFSKLLDEKKSEVIQSFAKSFQKVVKQSSVFACDQTDKDVVYCCLAALLKVVKDQTLADAKSEFFDVVKNGDLGSPKKQTYDSKFSDEDSLNAKFKIFVQNYHTACSTPNGIVVSSFQHLASHFMNVSTKQEIQEYRRSEPEAPADDLEVLVRLLQDLNSKMKRHLPVKMKNENDNMILECLQLLIYSMYCQLTQIPVDSDGKQLSDLIDKFAVPIQSHFIDLQVHETLIEFLNHSNADIAFCAMKLMSQILEYGNTNAQEKISELFPLQQLSLLARVDKVLVTGSSILQNYQWKVKVSKQKHMQDLRHISISVLEEAATKNGKLRDTSHFSTTNGTSSGKDTRLSVSAGDQNERGIPTLETNETNQSTSANEDAPAQVSIPIEMLVINTEEETQFGMMEGTVLEIINPIVKSVDVVLDFLCGSCNGPNRVMQDLLRKQDTYGHSTSYNIVGQVAVLLQNIASRLEKYDCISTAGKALQALIKMCTGNYQNQRTAFKGEVVCSIMCILYHGKITKEDPRMKELIKLKSSAIELLEVLLEETDKESQKLAQGICLDIRVDAVRKFMEEFWSVRKVPPLTSKQALYRAYHVLCKMRDYQQQLTEEFFEEMKKLEAKKIGDGAGSDLMMLHVKRWSCSIEINYMQDEESPVLTKVYFPYDPEDYLSKEEKDLIQHTIKRGNISEKQLDFIKWIQAKKKKLEYEEKIAKWKFLKWCLSLSATRNLILILLTLILNLLVVVVFGIEENDAGSGYSNNTSNSTSSAVFFVFRPRVPSWYGWVLYPLGALHLFLAAWMLVEFLLQNAPHFRLTRLSSLVYLFEKKIHKSKWGKALVRIYCHNRAHDPEPPDPVQYFEIELIALYPIYRFLFVAFSVVALFTWGYWYCCCLLYVFLGFTVLFDVSTALSRSAIQLISVFLLILSIIFIYAVFSFAFLSNFFDPTVGQFCNTLGECVVTVVREGFLGTISEELKMTIAGELPMFSTLGLRLIVDVSFFITVSTLGLNIVIAILVDRFSQIREERDQVSRDQQAQCFICSINSDIFERDGQGFWKHVHHDHNMWNYLYFALYVEKIYEKERSTLQRDIYQKVFESSPPCTAFFPRNKAKVLPNDGVKDNPKEEEKENSE